MSVPSEQITVTVDDQQPEVHVYVNDPMAVIGGVPWPPADGVAYVVVDEQWVDGSQYFVTEALTEVEQDPAPKLGGPLIVQNATPEETGRLFGTSETNPRAALFYTADGQYDPIRDEGFLVSAGGTELAGTQTKIHTLATEQFRTVYTTAEGNVYTTLPTPPKWETTVTDLADYDLGAGTGMEPWEYLAGLDITLQDEVLTGERLDAIVELSIHNTVATEQGAIDIGLGINGQQPTNVWETRPISKGYRGQIVHALTDWAGSYAPPDRLQVWARIHSGTGAGIEIGRAHV